MNQITFTMLCGCCVTEEKLIRKSRKISHGIYTMSKRCPDHKDGFFHFKENKCLDCDTITYQYISVAKVPKRCEPCRIKYKIKYQREYARVYFQKKVKVRREQKAIELKAKKAEDERRKDVLKKGEFRSPVAARTLAQAVVKMVACIPAKNLFEFNQSMRRGAI